ncbi:hypothetical protein [Methanobacterium sp.]|uniref:hypothetical protein n=1 Tax=Methanobacterium sp. TaxID=2164 RepID=UPI0031588341
MKNIRKRLIMTISMLLIVFAVFSIAVTANEQQNQSKNQASTSYIIPQINATPNCTNATPRNETNCTLNITGPILNQTFNCTNLTVTNQSTNQTLNRSTIRDIIGQLLAPVLNDTTNLTQTNATGQPLDKLLTDVNTMLSKIAQLIGIIRSGGFNITG